MKEIVAIIRPEKWQATFDSLQAVGVADVLHQRVLGRGQQLGLRYFRPQAPGGDGATLFLPKRMLTCLVEDSDVNKVVKTILQINQTGNFGDGKLFVCPLSVPSDDNVEKESSTRMMAST